MRPTRSGAIIVACLFVLASCGGTNQASTVSSVGVPTTNGKVNPTYATFCAAASKLNASSSGPHGENPTAITDPVEMKKTWATITQLSRALVDVTPSKLKKDATIVMNSIIAMDNIYKANSYNLLKMAKIPAVRLALQDIFVDLTLADASSRFSSFRITNCGE